ncbi:glycosyl hydrolase family 76-domain-containing protein [Pyronema domesticum]|nr:glycosyl hydrolase family 76-domain-containing protein [Pyronema domesticum]
MPRLKRLLLSLLPLSPLRNWPSGIDWTTAVLGTHLAAASGTLSQYPHTRGLSDKYFTQLVGFYYGQPVESLKQQAYDDILWVVLNWIEGLKTIEIREGQRDGWTGEEWRRAWADRAWDMYQVAEKGWDERLCGGGMVWSPWLEPYKNAITNELYFAASISMYHHHPYPPQNRTYLENAIKAYKWLKSSNMTNEHGLYTDGYHISKLTEGGTICDSRDEMVYTYNQGVVLTGLRGMAQAAEGTEAAGYILEGLALIDAVLSSEGTQGELVYDGVLTEKCDPGGYCSQNSQTFKGIFLHHLTTFCQPLSPVVATAVAKAHTLGCARYQIFMERQAEAASSTRNDAGIMGSWWGVPSGLSSSLRSTIDTRPKDTADQQNFCPKPLDAHACEASQRLLAPTGRGDKDKARKEKGDLNDRGRGRTVESHSGGVAALRAVLEMQRGQ